MISVASGYVLSMGEFAAPQKESIAEVVDILSQCEQPEMPVTHHFSPGIYCREIFMPALPGGGTLVVGHVHKTEHINIVESGRAFVTVGEDRFEVVGPTKFVSKAGSQKILHVVEDMRWTTVHINPQNITDVPTLESLIFDLPEEIIGSGLTLDEFRMNRNRSLYETSHDQAW